MSRTPGGSDDESAVPEWLGTTPQHSVDGSTDVPIAIDLPVLADDELDAPAADDEWLAREALAAAGAANGRVEVLMCARALRAEANGDGVAALGLWKAAFQRDPSLLVAFWGLRRALVRQGAWQELTAALDRRIRALTDEDYGAAAAGARADLWYQRARIEEDRLGRDEDAARSLRAGLGEGADHPGLLVSLLLLGFRRGEVGASIQALTELLRRTLPPAQRASATAWLARLERRSEANGETTGDPTARPAAARALEALQAALRTVGPEHAAPLLDELSMLARSTAAPATRAAILGEIVAQWGRGPTAPASSESARLVAVLRERARLLRDELGDPAGAIEALREAVRRSPLHPIALAELADLLEATGSGTQALRDLLGDVSPGDIYQTDPQRELALRVVAALGRQGHVAEALALLEGHAELPRHRPDVFALEVILRAALGDAAGLATAFEHLGARLLAAEAGADRGIPADVPHAASAASHAANAASHALVVAGALRETEALRRTEALRPSTTDAGEDGDPAARLYQRAVEIAPRNTAAWEALERRDWSTGRWSALAESLRVRLTLLEEAGASTERVRLLEDLVALHRDLLNDPSTALRYQERLLALTDPDGADATRAWVRRLDLDWRLAGRTGAAPEGTTAARTVLALRTLAEQAGNPRLAAALRTAGARVAADAGDVASAGELFAAAVPDDESGAAVAGLERLAGHPAAVGGKGADAPRAAAELRAGLIREEIARIEDRAERGTGRGADGDDHAPDAAARLRALRFRLAWHALEARHPHAAVEALGPLCAGGDAVAQAWSWEIGRRSGDPRLSLATLQTLPEGSATGALRARIDLAEALEQAGDLRGAEAAFRDVHQQEASTDAALGLLRVAAARGDRTVVLEATHALIPLADAQTAPLVVREAAMLALLQQPAAGVPAVAAAPSSPSSPSWPSSPSDAAEDPSDVVLGWARATRSGEPRQAAAALLALGRAIPATAPAPGAANDANPAVDRMGLLARAAARGRMGGTAVGAAVHDQVHALSAGTAPIGVGLADLPVAGRPERERARAARAERNGGALAYALEIERAIDGESRGDARAALEAFGRALARDPEGLEALDGVKRIALATGDRAGAARAGTRMGMVLRVPARAAAELGMAGQLWEDLDRLENATVVFWQALARDPRSEWLFERLRGLLLRQNDWAGLDLLFSHRLAALHSPEAQVTLLLERARHRLQHLSDRDAAIDDLKRILKLDADHAAALRLLATLAIEAETFRPAVGFLERLVGLTTDEDVALALRLELAEAHEAAREPGRAVEVLRQAVSARPSDATPWQRLIDLLLRMGDWSGALATLRSWDTVVAEPVAKSAVWLRIGAVLRDHARDPGGAGDAFATAAAHDPLGEGIRALMQLHERTGAAPAARAQAIERAILAMREALAKDPLDIPRLRRLRELHEWSAQLGPQQPAGTGADGATVVGQVLALTGEDVNAPATRRVDGRAALAPEFWTGIRPPGASEFASAVWPHLAGAVAELAPLSKRRIPAREKVAHGSEARLAWVETAAAVVGLPALELALAKSGATGDDGADLSVVAIEGAHPTLTIGRALLAGDAAARFRVGRALALLHDQATVLDRIDASDLGKSFTAGALVAGASLSGPAAPGVEERARALAKAMSRKDRKALELEASRFGFETIDAAGFRSAVLGTADRIGLLFAGDVAVAARLVANLPLDSKVTPPPGAIADSPRALALLRFALSEDYLRARVEMGQGPGTVHRG